KTTSPVAASSAGEAEFCDSPGAFQRFALRRSHLYQLHAEGLIEGCSLRRRGQQRGRRLWSIDSIRKYLSSQMDARATKSTQPRISRHERALSFRAPRRVVN